MPVPRAVIHINFNPILLMFEPRRIWTALRRAEERQFIRAGTRVQLELRLGNTAIYLATRDEILRAGISELRNSLASLAERVPDSWTAPNGVRVIRENDLNGLRAKVLLLIDSFLFEFRAYLELLAKFTYRVSRAAGLGPPNSVQLTSGEFLDIRDTNRKLITNNFLLYLCDQLGVSSDWYQFLSSHRNFFTHRGAPYLAIEDKLVRPPEYDFLVMRINIQDFAVVDPSDYFRLSECQGVVAGVKTLGQAVQAHLVRALEGT